LAPSTFVPFLQIGCALAGPGYRIRKRAARGREL
jgi:hypothetical protein